MMHTDIPDCRNSRRSRRREAECSCCFICRPRPCARMSIALHSRISPRMPFRSCAKPPSRSASSTPFERQSVILSGRIWESLDDNKHRLRGANPLASVKAFWKSQAHGLGVLARPETESLHTYPLPNRPKPLAEVADQFHLAPLIRTMTFLLEIFVLAISEGGARLLHAVVNMPPARIPVAHLFDEPADPLASLRSRCGSCAAAFRTSRARRFWKRKMRERWTVRLGKRSRVARHR